MSLSPSSTTNPFAEIIVKDPRRREVAVPGANQLPLETIIGAFDGMNEGEAPRPVRLAECALLVTSEQPGYGKSHLIGRLFRELHLRATLVYVQPFQGAGTVFQALLMAVVRELHFPEQVTSGSWDGEAPTQLDGLAHAVLAHLLADLIESDGSALQISAGPEALRMLRHTPLAAFDRGADGWAKWLQQHWDVLLPFFEEALARRGLELGSPGAWLRILRIYTFSPAQPAARRLCLDWITGQPIDRQEATALGLRASEATGEELSPENANALARTRLGELCQLASFHRPFVFCFDQTEVYGHRPALARAFGMLVATLVHEAPNQLTVITANQEPWSLRVLPHVEMADRDRISPPLPLEGLRRDQAAELARLRLQAANVPADRATAFLSPKWLAELFPTETHQLGARPFLQKCRARWSETPLEPPTLDQLWKEHRAKILASPKRQGFEGETLRWLVEEAARGLPGLTIETSSERYFSVRWVTAEGEVLFGFIPGTHWNQWRNIARVAEQLHDAAATDRPVKCVFFRTPEQAVIPGPDWTCRAEIEAAQKRSLQIVPLDLTALAELYAARDLFSDAVQQDIDYTPEQVLAFLHTALQPWWERLRAPVVASAAVTSSPAPAPSETAG